MDETLTISSQDISVDGQVIAPQLRTRPQIVSVEAARQALEALAAHSALALVDVEARLVLQGRGDRISVRNNGGKLFGCRLPEGINTASACTPGEAIAWVQASAAPVSIEVGDEKIDSARKSRPWRSMMSSPWLLAVLLVIAAGTGYLNFSGDDPDDIQYLAAPAAIAAAQAQVQGSYAESTMPGRTVMTVDGSTLRIERQGKDSPKESIIALSFRIGHREQGGQLVLVASNGAVLDAVPGVALRYGVTTYKRLGSPRP